MLRILNMKIPYEYKPKVSAKKLFEDNACFVFEVEAPIYWWAEFSGERVNLCTPCKLKGPMQKLPLDTLGQACIFLHYQDIVEICEDYIDGAYTKERSKWIAEREWTDFCETLFDIRGVRDLLYGEEI